MKGRDTILSIRDLEVTFKVRDRQLKAIRRISFDLYRGETLAIVGESGSGKSVLMKSLTGMLESNGTVSGGSIRFFDEELAHKKKPREWESIRGAKIATVFQDPMTSLNPVRTIGSQIVEVNVMWFWWFMLCCDLMIPLLMIVIGRLMWKRPPQKINSLIGYRTSRSMKNMDTWHFAHHYCGKLWWRIGWIILVPSLIIHLPFYGASDDAIGIVGLILTFIQIAVLIGSIFPTEKALKRTFTEEGLRR